MEGTRFSLPLQKLSVEQIDKHLRDRQCMVISFFGKSPYSMRSNKGGLIDSVLGQSVFGGAEFGAEQDGRVEPLVEGFFCPDRDCVFLHMRSWMDTFSLAEKVRQEEELLQNKGMLAFWSSRRYEHARALLALFHLSHILVCCHPGQTFDISYVHLFKSLDNLRNKVQGSVSTVVRAVAGLPRDWAQHGRPASPRVLFTFLSCPSALRGTRGQRDERRDAKPHKHPPIKRLEHSLEDQIYRILRKARIITNIAANSLFALPSNQEFVYVETGGGALDNQAALLQSCLAMMGGQETGLAADTLADRGGPFYSQFVTEEDRPTRCFSNFLAEHINVGFERGFNDNISKHGTGRDGGSHWETCSLAAWLELATNLFSLFSQQLTSEEGHTHSEAMMTLRDDLETEIMFSELRCKKILPSAMGAYKEGLPPHYTAEYHNAKLLAAMSVYSMQARGPASEKFAELLAADCNAHWQAGRRMCEEISLTGNHCTARRHALSGQEQPPVQQGKKPLPVMQCSSGVQYIAACNCGRRQANKEDPFKLVDANYNFYAELEEDCCKELEHVAFPVSEHSPAKLNISASDKSEPELTEKMDNNKDTSQVPAVPDLKLVEMKAEDEESEERRSEAGVETEIILEVLENLTLDTNTGKSPSKVASLLSRASSQSEFLSTMKTLNSPAGSKPLFPSWSLVLVGSSHLYSHSAGLGSQPGFMSSSKFLLPWEIPLTQLSPAQLAERWPNIVENAAKRASLRSPDEPTDSRITVKAFLGFEYECPRGHRFMVSAPDRPMKSSSTMREAANKLVASQLPLYMACPCRITKPPVAQLTRIHVVTPKAPVFITLEPRVQPSQGGPVFVTGWEAPHRLTTNSYWVLRLPSVYWGEGGAHLPPPVPPQHGGGVLLSGALGYTEDYTDG